MKTRSQKPGLKSSILILILLGILVACLWITFLWLKLPHDDYRQNLTISEAQALVSFKICLPTYISQAVEPNPTIVYQADASNILQEKIVRLEYKSINGQEIVFEIYENYTLDTGMKTAYSESTNGGAKASLLDWLSYPKLLSESEIEAADGRTEMEATAYQTDQIVWWLYQITDPIEYRSTMTKWIGKNVEYRIMSYLPVNEIKKVTESMFDCLNY